MVRIEGPLDLFSGSKRYRMKMAAVADMPQLGAFSCEAKVESSLSKRPFLWTDKDRVKSHYRPYFEYTSEERSQFEKLVPWLEKVEVECPKIEMSMAELMKGHYHDYALKTKMESGSTFKFLKTIEVDAVRHAALRENSEQRRWIRWVEKDLEKFVSDERIPGETIYFNKNPRFTQLKSKLKELGFVK